MQPATARLLETQKAALHSCPVCPVKGACVFATPGYEPGYCLHEYRLLHAFVAQRLRSHPPAGAQTLSRVMAETAAFVERTRKENPYGLVAGGFGAWATDPAWPRQSTLALFAPA